MALNISSSHLSTHILPTHMKDESRTRVKTKTFMKHWSLFIHSHLMNRLWSPNSSFGNMFVFVSHQFSHSLAHGDRWNKTSGDWLVEWSYSLLPVAITVKMQTLSANTIVLLRQLSSELQGSQLSNGDPGNRSTFFCCTKRYPTFTPFPPYPPGICCVRLRKCQPSFLALSNQSVDGW